MSAELYPGAASEPFEWQPFPALRPFVADATLYAPTFSDGDAGQDGLHEAWHSDGGDGLAKIDGDFVFADWDPDGETLTLGRDHLGVRPLFYVRDPGRFVAFASFASILARAGLASGKANADTVGRAARTDYGFGSASYLAGVHRVRPAHVIAFRGGDVSETRYWRPVCRNPIPPDADFGETAAELRAHLDRAVRKRLAGPCRPATHLSGGLDSQAIAVLAGRAAFESGGTITGYSVTASEAPRELEILDESTHAAITAQAEPGLTARFVPSLGRAEMALGELAPEGPYSLAPDEPTNRILAEASEAGTQMILSGFGGDELLSYNGLGAFAEQFLNLRWRRLWSALTKRSQRTGDSRFKLLAVSLEHTVLPVGVASALRSIIGRPRKQDDPFDGTLRWGSPQRPFRPDTLSNRMTMLERGHLQATFEGLAWRAARFGMAYSFPLLDKDALAFGLRLPSDFFIADGNRRTIFRAAMAGVLPETVRTHWRKLATDPTINLSLSMNRGSLHKALERAGSDGTVCNVFDIGALHNAVDDLPDPDIIAEDLARQSRRGLSYISREGLFYWHLMLSRYQAGIRDAGAEAASIRSVSSFRPTAPTRARGRDRARRRN